ncbi:hypothetical protein HanOQP8_Chr16g0624351 [Helianthus annuus]|nr:hypothetical protein HanHA89_Chr16g0669271 [Helianthus annuus]KAJ0641593.1 hypothetical protein HanLR1_Chr16g0628981 [Helianthus annuus]KAJ0645475.1 hypothetical protein HanOQP8_Chr16g0624351 [Helianthus annuus]
MITSSENHNSICDNFLSRYQHEDSSLGLTGNPHQHHGLIKHRFWISNIFVTHNPGEVRIDDNVFGERSGGKKKDFQA